MSAVAERHEYYLIEHDRFARERAASTPAWLRDLHRRALTRFADTGFPTTREEEWRFTSVAPIAETAFRLAGDERAGAAELVEAVSFDGVAARVVVVNGRFAPELSAVPAPHEGARSLVAGGLAAALAKDGSGVEAHLAKVAFEDRPFVALNTAFLADGAYVAIAPGAVLEQPIHIVIVATPGARDAVVHPRVLIAAGPNSQARIVETYVGAKTRYLTNAVTEVVLGENAVVDHCKDQREPVTAFHVATMHVRLARDGNFASQNFVFGGGLVRNDIVAVLGGPGGEVTLNGLYFSDGQRLVDTHTLIDHAAPHCPSHELYKGILAGRARAVFNGKIIVRPDAQKTDAKQTNRALLLSDDAQINTKPQLEIFADDVKCTHGAAIGQLDEEALFYLRTRGLTAIEARDLLIHAFAGEILDRVKVEPVRRQMEAALFEQLAEDLEGSRA